MKATPAPSEQEAYQSLDSLNVFFEREHIIALYQYIDYSNSLPKGVPATAAWLGQLPIEHPEFAVSKLSALFEKVREHAEQGTVIIKDMKSVASHFAEISETINTRSEKLAQTAQAICALDGDEMWEAVLAAPPSSLEEKNKESLAGFIEDLQDIKERIAVYQFVLEHEAGLLQKFFSTLNDDLIQSAANIRRAISGALQSLHGDGVWLQVENYAEKIAQAEKIYSTAVRDMFEISNEMEVSVSLSCLERATHARKEIAIARQLKLDAEQQLAIHSPIKGDLLKLSAFLNALNFNFRNILAVFAHVETFLLGLDAHMAEAAVKVKGLQTNHDVAFLIASLKNLMRYWNFISSACQKSVSIFTEADPAGSA
ncbi:hypothetical protein [Pseudomonas sp. UBA6562]|uniref:hypothetical protein n=1 Tax=Pseudomonas sp. UBA6562 TaxID=1947332 RepID=UPI0025D0098B|nr:hypothetical protein [Pseudomonas sp. UBA6562]